MGFADPEAGIGYAYVTSHMGTTLTGDPRDVALRNAVLCGAPELPFDPRSAPALLKLRRAAVALAGLLVPARLRIGDPQARK